jgi:serine/threonine protein kinase
MLSPGTMLGGRYRLDERIAGGGMGDVWRATDEVLGRTVAVKVLLQALVEEPGFAERFRGEARTMATINHPGVVDVYDYGNENDTAFLVMEYIEGDALSRTLSRVGRLTPARTMALMAQAADALHAAHEKGIVHRDVKPGNLLVRPNGTLVLTDFGIARSAMVGQLTAAGSVLGTASYISPEQASGQGATPLSDVYALGVVAYQCLSGRRPFEGENPLEIAMRHVRDQPPPLPPDIPQPARQIVDTAMSKDPNQRYPSAAALGQVARRAAGQLAAASTAARPAVPSSAMPGSPMMPPGSPVSAMPGAPMSGPPGAPMSGPPGQPVSGAPGTAGPSFQPGPAGMPPGMQAGPTSGPPGEYQPGPSSGPPSGFPPPTSGGPYGDGPKPGGPVGASGTRVMPASGMTGPVPSGPPSGPGGGPPPPPGQFARGAAGVPPPPQQPSDTGYTYVQTSMVPGAPPQNAPASGGAPGGGGPLNRRNPKLLALIAGIGALALILCVGGGVFFVNTLGDDKPDDKPTAAASVSAAPTGPMESIDCKNLTGQPIAAVRNHLANKDGFKVKEVEVDDNARAGTVVKIDPCGDQPKGSEVTVSVSNGRGGGAGNGGQSGGPNPTCQGNFPFGCQSRK